MLSDVTEEFEGGNLQEDIKKKVDRIREIAETLQSEKALKSPEERILRLQELRGQTVRLNILKNFGKLDEKTLSVLYLLKTVLNDYWRNLGGDATFGFEKVLDELQDETVAFSKNIGRFVYLSIVTNNDEKAVNALFESIALYYSCLSHLREKGEQIYTEMKK